MTSTTASAAVKRPFTGRHMTAILVAFFGVVIAVNVLMAHFATSTFGGIVVENSYVASQDFNRWLDEARTEKALGWTVHTGWRPDGKLAITATGPSAAATLTGMARHPLGRLPDVPLTFVADGKGTFVSDQKVPDGRWQLRLEMKDGSKLWRREDELK
ncbi:MAG: Integral rane protein linked to a cation pump-like protein [Pseudomonadota bacterium]|jgi:nitrogen fixation protein FixH